MENNKINRDNFIKILSSLTPQEVNEIIEQKGKKAKSIPMVLFY